MTSTQLAAYAALFDFRTQIVKAARQILSAGGIEAIGPGEGQQKLPRYFVAVDFVRGAFDPTIKQRLVQDLGAGARRSSMYCAFTGTLMIENSVPFETEEKSGSAYLTEDHARTLDELVSQQLALFMEPLQPFTAALLPNLDIQQIVPIEPDDRPVSEREVNIAYNRWLIRATIRPGAWPDVA